MEWISKSAEETHRLGAQLAQRLEPQDVLALTGEIGSGKTTFVQGMAEGLGVAPGLVASPSFVLVKVYRGRIPLVHADLFRLEGLEEAATVGIEEFYESDGVTVVEWGTQVPGVLPEDFLEICFSVIDPDTRKLTLVPHGPRYEARKWRG